MTFLRPILLLLHAGFVGCACASAAPAAPIHSHAPPASSHGVVTLDQFVTTASPFARNQVDLAQSTTVLSGQSLLIKQQPTLGETLAAETGIHASSFGPGSSRPIIRGLGGDRIRLLENSVGTIDASVISPDHAVSVEPFLVERIEIVRGPASLLYGSNAIGGAVNVITHRIETDVPAEPIRGGGELRGGTAADERAGGGVLDLAFRMGADRALVFHGDAFIRRTENLRIPGFAESAALREQEIEHARERGDPSPSSLDGKLPNSAIDSRSGAIGFSYVTPSFHFGISQSGLDSDYGVPGHAHDADGPAVAEGVRIDLRQRRTDLQGEWHAEGQFIQGARLKFGRARYRHREIAPDGETGTVFTNRGFDGRLEVLHGGGSAWSGAVGAQLTRSDFAAVGEEAFLPGSRTDSAAVFVFEEISSDPVAWQFGARHERTRIGRGGFESRRDNEPAASIGAVWKIDDAHVLAISLSHSGRAPNAQELFAYGFHAGTNSFEIGSATLRPERSLGWEASLRRRKGLLTGALTVFMHRFRGFIFEQPTGLVAFENAGEWFLVASDGEAGARKQGLPVYQYVQRNARFQGGEVEAVAHLHESTRWNLDWRVAADVTRAREAGRNLPRIPAIRATTGLAWSSGPWSGGAEFQRVFRQNRVAANETPSDGYSLLSAYVSRTLEFGSHHLEFFLRGSNLTNAEARPHTSFVKDFAPLAGRSAAAGLRVAF